MRRRTSSGVSGAGHAAFAADHEQLGIDPVAAAQQCQALDDVVDPLAWHHAAQLQDDELALGQAELDACHARRHWPQFVRVKATRGDLDALWGRAVELLHVALLLRTFGNDAVGVVHQGFFDLQAFRGEGVGGALGQAPHLAQRMEGDDERNSQHVLDMLGHHARHEEIGMHDVVQAALALGEAGDITGEAVHVGQHLFLRDVMGRAGRHMDHADVVAPLDQWRLAGRVAAGEDVDLVTGAGQLARQVGHIHILAAAVDAAWRRQGRGVLADNADAPHGAAEEGLAS
jgi:GNAT superfamily N-acetyltransferase